MKQFKKLILSMFVVLSTGLYANAVNMAPIITYLLSDTTSSPGPISASDFTMKVDVNESAVTEDWKTLSLVNDTEATASVKTHGIHGAFEVNGDSLSYLKSTETNATDSGILEITNGVDTKEITVTVESLYWKQIATGNYHTAAIKSDGTLWSWGTNYNGCLGNHTVDRSFVPIQEFTESSNWIFLAAGYNHTFAIKSDGTLWAWGANAYGQLGDGTRENKYDPIQIGTDYIFVSGGLYHTAAIKSNGTLWSWGYNLDGQLGDNTTVDKNVSTQEDTNTTDWVSVDAGGYHTVAIKSDGSLWSWGYNGYGQLGDGTTGSKYVPTQVATNDTNWSSVSTGKHHTAAITSDDTLWLWGSNSDGQLGDNTKINKYVPTQEDTNATDWSAVSLGFYHTVTLKSDGSIWSWGYNTFGEIGDGTAGFEDKLVPTREYTNADNWSTIIAGTTHTMAIKSDSTLWGWGYNQNQVLGEGTGTDRNTTIPTLSFIRQP